MKRNVDVITGSVLLSFALAVGACSSDSAAPATPSTAAPTTTEAPVPTTVEAAPPTSAPSTAPPASPGPESDEGAADLIAELEASGFVGTLIVQSPDGDLAEGFGSADRGADLDNGVDTVFDIGSITKQFTAAAILRLEMDGALTVEDPVGQYVQGLTVEQSEITLHQLLTHTGGLPAGIGFDEEAIDLPDYIARLAGIPLDESLIGNYSYSNTGYSLLTAVIESVTGGSYETYLQDALFEPAGMTQTGYVLPDWSAATIAVGYEGDDVFGRPNEQPWDVDGPWWNLRGNGGLLSTMPDLLAWDAALRGDAVLDAAAKEKMYTPYVTVEGEASYGYGWIIVPLADGSTLITHDGGNNVFYADFVRLVDQDITVVLASNVANPEVFGLGVDLAAQLWPDLFGDEGGICELDVTLTEATGSFDVVADYPDTPAGRAMSGWIDVLLSQPASDESMLRSYVEASVGTAILDEVGVDATTEIIRSLTTDFDGFTVDRMFQEDEATFHVVVANTLGIEAMISATVGAEPESRIDCIGFSS